MLCCNDAEVLGGAAKVHGPVEGEGIALLGIIIGTGAKCGPIQGGGGPVDVDAGVWD